MTAASFPLFTDVTDPLFSSIVGEDSGHFYVSKPFVFLGCMVMLMVRVLGPLLLVQCQLYRMRQISTVPVAAGEET